MASRSRSTATSTASFGSIAPGAVQGDGMTQFGRSLHALNIDILCANTPQAKGRVERANKTLQDRLVKDAASRDQHDCRRQSTAAGFPGRLQRPLWQGAAQSQEPPSALVS